VALATVALLMGILPLGPHQAELVRAVTPGTTEFDDINPDDGGPLAGQPGLGIEPCPDPCASQHNGGRVNGLAVVNELPGFTPTTYFAASEVGGLFKSVDGGGHWTHLDTFVPNMPWDVAVEPGALRVYATSFYDGRTEPLSGIQLSTNGGQTWTRPTIQPPAECDATRASQPSAFGIALRPGSDGEVLVGTNCGIARSVDHGQSWVQFDPSPGVANSIWDIDAQPGGRTYACGDDGLLASPSGAPGSWTLLGKPTSTLWGTLGGYCSLAVAPDETSVVFVAFATAFVGDIVTARRPELFEWRTEDVVTPPQVQWTQLPYPDDVSDPTKDRKSRTPTVVTNDRTAGFDPANPADGYDLWFGDGSLWRIPCHTGQTPRCSTIKAEWDGSFTDHIGSAQEAHGDSGDLTFDPGVAVDACPTIYSSDGGVYANARDISDPTNPTIDCHSPDFLGANVGLHAFYLRGMAGYAPASADPQADEDLYFGTQDNGIFYSSDAGAQTPTWTHGMGGDVLDIAADGVRTVTTRPGNTLDVGDRGFENMFIKAGGIYGQPLWDSEALVQAGPGRYLIAQYGTSTVNEIVTGTQVVVPRGIRDIDIANVDSDPMGVPFGNVPWPAAANPPCHVVVAMGPSGVVPYVLAGQCWYGTLDIARDQNSPSSGPDQLWTFRNGGWERLFPGPAQPGGTVEADASFGLVAVHPTDPMRVYAAVLFDGPSSRMMRSTDGGQSWTTDWALTRLMYGGFEPDIADSGDGVHVMPQASLVAFDRYDPDIVVAGGRQSGIFISSDGGRGWALLTEPHAPTTSGVPHLPNPAFAHFDHDKPGVVRIYVGTGRGVWRINLANADLSVTKADAPDPVVAGKDLIYTIQVSNAGPDLAQNATLEDVLPDGVTFRSILAPSGWSCDLPAVDSNGTVYCTNPSMVPGTATFSLVVRIGAGADLDGVTNTVRSYSAAVDPDTTANEASATTSILIPVAINIQPGGSPNTVNSRGRANVAILSTSVGEYGLPFAFDAGTVSPLGVRFGPESLVLAGGGAGLIRGSGHLEDSFELDEVTQDGDLDLVLQFRVADSGLTTTSTEACVAGTFGAGYRFIGCDAINVVP
jgi:uncharacterized repeat protein (TIGR01451 family)